jgi:DNA-binding LacI/PurR family transcriptional regulator
MTLALLRQEGVEADGEIMDPDPYAAIMDAVGEEEYDEIIVSTHPETRSGWLRENLVDRVARATRRPVEHVVVDLDVDRDDATRTLVVANETVAARELIETLKQKASEGDHQFFVILPQSGAEDGDEEAAERLATTLKELEEAGIQAMGQVVHPDPYTAIQNAVQSYGADEVIISTFPEMRSGWLRNNLLERVKSATNRPVEHIVSEA